jgi:hypothetical protein
LKFAGVIKCRHSSLKVELMVVVSKSKSEL